MPITLAMPLNDREQLLQKVKQALDLAIDQGEAVAMGYLESVK